jgi:uncharacterized protein YggE
MSYQKIGKYIFPAFVALALLAVFGIQQAPAEALRGENTAITRPAPVPEQSSGDSYDPVSVAGFGRVVEVPDEAHISLEVTVLDQSIADARQEMADTTERIVTSLRSNGVADTDMMTTHLRVSEEWERYYGQREDVFRGYRVSNGLSVTVRDSNEDNGQLGSDVAEIIDDAITAGDDHIRFHGLSFAFSPEVRERLEREARRLSVQNMHDKAAQLAEFGGRNLGLLREIYEGSYGGGYTSRDFYYDVPAAASVAGPQGAAGPSTPVLVGESEVTVRVSGVYELLGPTDPNGDANGSQ